MISHLNITEQFAFSLININKLMHVIIIAIMVPLFRYPISYLRKQTKEVLGQKSQELPKITGLRCLYWVLVLMVRLKGLFLEVSVTMLSTMLTVL